MVSSANNLYKIIWFSSNYSKLIITWFFFFFFFVQLYMYSYRIWLKIDMVLIHIPGDLGDYVKEFSDIIR